MRIELTLVNLQSTCWPSTLNIIIYYYIYYHPPIYIYINIPYKYISIIYSIYKYINNIYIILYYSYLCLTNKYITNYYITIEYIKALDDKYNILLIKFGTIPNTNVGNAKKNKIKCSLYNKS